VQTKNQKIQIVENAEAVSRAAADMLVGHQSQSNWGAP